MKFPKKNLTSDLELDYLELTLYMCSEIEKDTLTLEQKYELALNLRASKKVLSETINKLTLVTGVKH